MAVRFRDRAQGGEMLADRVAALALDAPVVLALPRGGVPVAWHVAARLNAPLDVFVARKVGAPGHPEYGIGAVAEGGGVVVNDDAVRALGLSPDELSALVAREREELDRRVRHYRGGRPLPALGGRDVVLVDDGLATGVTAEASLRALRAAGPSRLVLAVPTCSPDTAERLRAVADDVVCVIAPPDFRAVGEWYERFDQTSDAEVLDLLLRSPGLRTGR